MIELTNTKFGTKRKAIIGGVNFDLLQKNMQIYFYVQLLNDKGDLLDDKSINQNRAVSYNLSNNTFINNKFALVDEKTVGAKPEFDYFINLMQSISLPTLILQLGAILNERGIFK